MSKDISLKAAAERLCAANKVLILIHKFPDGDTIGCGYALCRCLQKLGKLARVECADVINERYDYITCAVEKQDFEPELIVSVDVADERLLGEELCGYYGKIDLAIDHHGSNTGFAAERFVAPEHAAACEIVYQLIRGIMPVDRDMANALYTGIATDTGCFKFANTTADTHRIAAELIELGINSGDINRIMFDTKTKSRVLIEQSALQSIVFSHSDRCAMMTITAHMKQTAGASDDELEGITSLPRQIEGVIIGITVRERTPMQYKISVRTHEPISASEFCKQFGGGGHDRAAGCELCMSLEKAQSLLQNAADAALTGVGL